MSVVTHIQVRRRRIMTTATISGNSIGPAPSHHPWMAVARRAARRLIASFDVRLFALGLPDLEFGLSFDEGAWLATASGRAADPHRPRHRLACRGLRLAPRNGLAEPGFMSPRRWSFPSPATTSCCWLSTSFAAFCSVSSSQRRS